MTPDEFKKTLRKTKKKRARPEDDIQIKFVKWVHKEYKHMINAQQMFIHHSANEGNFPAHYHKKLSQMGKLKGFPDLLIDIQGKAHYMEIKAPNGRMQHSQNDFKEYCMKNAIPHAVPRSTEEAKKFLKVWIEAI